MIMFFNRLFQKLDDLAVDLNEFYVILWGIYSLPTIPRLGRRLQLVRFCRGKLARGRDYCQLLMRITQDSFLPFLTRYQFRFWLEFLAFVI
jgi:hypothetical protein